MKAAFQFTMPYLNTLTHYAVVIAITIAIAFVTTADANEPGKNAIGQPQMDLSEIGINNDSGKLVTGTLTAEDARRMLAAQLEQTKQEILGQLCDQKPFDRLCSIVPHDNIDFSELFVYMFINAVAQNSFDIFSWQSFIAMNWPLDSDGVPAPGKIGALPDAARAWSTYQTPQQLFNPDFEDTICGARGASDLPTLTTSSFIQTSGFPLIDRNLNYTVYDVRINHALADYIVSNGLNTVEGQVAFQSSGQEIEFPRGFYSDPATKAGGAVGAAAIKSAWKIIDQQAGDDESRYFTIKGRIPISAEDSTSGKAFCLETRLALVGMHIMRRTQSGHGDKWIWSTFEHVDNAPIAANARKSVDTLHDELFQGGCKSPDKLDKQYAFFNQTCPDCATNQLSEADWKWSPTPPHAAAFATKGQYGTQVVRCWQTFEGTALVNNLWQQSLSGTPWANYESVSAQWKGANPGVMFPQGEVPRFLTNSTMETYDQYSDKSSCLSCHADAVSVAGQDSKFSFLLSMAARYRNTDD